jgi:ornithine carbamoyltransferase
VHCLPALHDKNTVVRGEIIEETGMDDRLENRLHTIKAVLVAMLGSC